MNALGAVYNPSTYKYQYVWRETCLTKKWYSPPVICDACKLCVLRENRLNVNALVNSELYAHVSTFSAKTVAYLKRTYTPQQMRGVLLQKKDIYYHGPEINTSCGAPKKQNRGVVKRL